MHSSYDLEAYKPFARECVDLLVAIEDGQAQGIASVLVMSEVLVKPLQTSKEAGRVAQQFLRRMKNVSFVPVSKAIAQEAAILRAYHGSKLKLSDAIHLATALVAGAEVFVTNDQALGNLHIDGLAVKLLGGARD